MLLEIACFNLESCLIAQKAGANRIELCENYSVGGITPPEKLISEVRKQIHIDLFVMIRPRKGNFLYSDSEFELMKKQIILCKEKNCNGVVFGILTNENKIDIDRCKVLVELAKPMSSTFHRAFDEIENVEQALGDCIECDFLRILSSGKEKTAVKGATLLEKLIKQSNKRITIMPGGDIRSSNIAELKTITCATEFHSAAITTTSEIADEAEIKKMLSLL